MTQEKLHELQRDLVRLKKIQPEAAAEVARLAELGDFSENAEYQLAKGRLRGILAAMTRLEYEITNAQVIEQADTNTVQLGHRVTIENGGKQKTVTVLGSSEVDPERGVISYSSPLGAALMGHAVGDVVTVQLATKTVAYTIIQIQ